MGKGLVPTLARPGVQQEKRSNARTPLLRAALASRYEPRGQHDGPRVYERTSLTSELEALVGKCDGQLRVLTDTGLRAGGGRRVGAWRLCIYSRAFAHVDEKSIKGRVYEDSFGTPDHYRSSRK